MDRITLLENDDASLWFYPEIRIIHHQFHQKISSATFRKVLSAGLAVLPQYQVKKWLSDDRKNSMLLPEDTEWSDNIWLPKMVKAGWKYWAILLPLDLKGKINLTRQVEGVAEKNVICQFFDDPEEAMEWLKNLPA